MLLLLLGRCRAKHDQRPLARYQAWAWAGRTGPEQDSAGPLTTAPDGSSRRPVLPGDRRPADGTDAGPQQQGAWFAPRRPRVPRWVKWTAVLVVLGLIFRKAVASVVLLALSAALHLIGMNVHLPSIKFAWPWQAINAGTKTNTDLGPWVLQKIEGISRPALGQANFNFVFTHKVSKSIGPWPCWYASTFYAVGHASATVDLNPGPSWWTPATGHYRLQVLSRPAGRQAGPCRGDYGPAAAAASAVSSRRDDRQPAVEADRYPAQLDLSGAWLWCDAAAAVPRVGALRPGADHRVLQGHPLCPGHRSAH